MKTIYHPADERGKANFGWLDSHHSFSFGHYHDPQKMHFGALRVLNDDVVTGGEGFGAHPHDNMEIVSIPLLGALQHKDSTGRNEIIKQHDVQIMSAGTGITHSEFNASETDAVNFLQLWIFPKKRNIEPRYEQKAFSPTERSNRFQTVVAPDDSNAVQINQDAWFSLGNFDTQFSTTYNLHKKGNGVYAFIIEGSVTINGQQLNKRDGFGISDVEQLDIMSNSPSEILLIEVPMVL
jgi:redox-sensitive bicupin YhaK (pirin superfamily)